MGGWFKFWIRCLQWATRPWDRGTTFLGNILSLLGIVGLLASIAPFIVLVLFIAPYKLHQRQQNRADELQERIKPQLKIIKEVEIYKITGERRWGIEVHNIGVEKATECHGRLEDIEFESPIKGMSFQRWPKNIDLHWLDQPEGSYYYDLPGEQAATLQVIYSTRLTLGNWIRFAYLGGEESRTESSLSLPHPILLRISITSKDKSPTYAICRIDVQAANNLVLEGLSRRRPFTILWHGSKLR